MYGTSHPSCDGSEGIGSSSIILYGVDYWVVFGVILCEGLIRESIMAVCKFYELDCECSRG